MQKGVRTALVVAGLAGCHTADPGVTPDAPSGFDGPLTSGLSVVWSAKPATIPGPVKDDLTVSRVVFRMANVRVIGDAGPGDPRTSASSFSIEWSEGATPSPLIFADAPSGLYSWVNVLADGDVTNYSYEIYGTVRVSGEVRDYRVRDSAPLDADVSTQLNLDPGMTATASIRIEIDDALENVHFDDLPTNDGMLDLATTDDQMPAFRQNLMDGFVNADH